MWIISQLFYGGRVLETKKTELTGLSEEDMQVQALSKRAKAQHVVVLKRLVTGKIEAAKKLKTVTNYGNVSLMSAPEASVLDEFHERPIFDIAHELKESDFEKKIVSFLDSLSDEWQ
ncbi:MAG: hypothetical protein R3A11_06130 [Bdellovibrionota bacterium]